MSKKLKEHNINVSIGKHTPKEHLSCNVCGKENILLNELTIMSGMHGTCIRMCDDCVNKLWVASDQAMQKINKNF
ncbi:MAG: hypothetical protein ACRC23_01920 [Aeromonas jandaei]